MLQGLKSYIVAAAIVALGAFEQAGFIHIVPPGYEGIALSLAGLAMAALRKVSTGPAAL